MSFHVAQAVHDLGLRAAAVVFREVKISESDPALRDAIRQEAAGLRPRLSGDEAPMLPEIEYFASVLRKVGVNPRRNRPSLEKLVNSMLKRGDLPAINTLVDAYKSSSLAAIRVLAYNFAKGRESRLSRSSATRRNCV